MTSDYGSSPRRPSRNNGSRSDPYDEPEPSQGKQHTGIATIGSSVANLTNTVIGTGALAFASAFATMGIIPGVLTCVFSGCMTGFGLYLLTRCATMVGTKPGEEGKKASFAEVAKITFTKGWPVRLFDAAIAIKCFGVSVSYLIICKTLLPQVALSFSRLVHSPLASESILLSQDFWLCASMVVIVPLSFLRTLDSLRFTSQIALATVVYLIIVVVGWYFIKGASPTRGDVVLGRFGKSTLSSFPVQVFAYTCAQNIFPIYNELKNPTQKRLNSVIFLSLGSAATCYEILGVIGYLTFGSKVGSNIIAMYSPTSTIIALGRLGIVLLVGLSYPLQALPCRACLHGLTSGLFRRKKKPIRQRPADSSFSRVTAEGEEVEEDEEEEDPEEQDPLVPKVGQDGKNLSPDRPRSLKFYILTVGILVSGFLIALAVDELEVVLGFVGSTGSTIISFILPGFFYFKLFRNEPGPTKWMALALSIYGFAVMSFCLTFNIIKLVIGQTPVG